MVTEEGETQKVTVALRIDHTYRGDLLVGVRIYLSVGPGGEPADREGEGSGMKS